VGKHRVGTDRSQQAERTRGRLVEAACRLFTVDGYAATSMNAIAREAGVTKGALYHHFDDKRAVYEACYHAAQARVPEIVAATPPGPPEADRFDRFSDAFVGFLRSAITDRWVVAVAVAEAPIALGRAEFLALDDQYSWPTIGRPLERLQQLGLVRDDVDVAQTVGLLNAVANEAALRVFQADDPEAEHRRVAPVVRALLAGLRAG
jgi:AcrR family transcriptional regulator